MKRKKRIENILKNNLNSQVIEIIDKSSKHTGHNKFTGKDETHFSIILSKNIIDGNKIIDIHRKINFLLKNEFLNGLHSLEIKFKD